MTIFMGKIVDILNLPSNYLLITKSEILYKKGKKQFTFKISEIKYEFHSFFEDFESLSQLVIFSSDITYYVNITKKQFRLIEQFLKIKNRNNYLKFDEFDSPQELLDKFSINDNGFK